MATVSGKVRFSYGEQWENFGDLEREVNRFIPNNAQQITSIQVKMWTNAAHRSQGESIKKLLHYNALYLEDLELQVWHAQDEAVDSTHPIHTLAIDDCPNLSKFTLQGTFLHSSMWQSAQSLRRLAFHDATISPGLSISHFCNALGSLPSLEHLEMVRYICVFDRETPSAQRPPVPLAHLQTLRVRDDPHWIQWLMYWIKVGPTTSVEFVFDDNPEGLDIIAQMIALPRNRDPERLRNVNALELDTSKGLTLIGRESMGKPLEEENHLGNPTFKVSIPTVAHEASPAQEHFFLSALGHLPSVLPPAQVKYLNVAVSQMFAIPQQVWHEVLQYLPELRTIRVRALPSVPGLYFDPLGMRTLLCTLEEAMPSDETMAICPLLERLEITGIPVSEAWIETVIKSVSAREVWAMLVGLRLGLVLDPPSEDGAQRFPSQWAAMKKLWESLKTDVTVTTEPSPN